MKKKQSKGGGTSSAPMWGNMSGWKAVDVGDEFLLGAEESGFAGLEILENPEIFDDNSLPGKSTEKAPKKGKQQKQKQQGKAQAQGQKQQGKQQAAGSKRKQRDAAAGSNAASKASGAAGDDSTNADDVEALKMKLKQLEEENARLKGGKRQKLGAEAAAAASAAPAAAGADTPAAVDSDAVAAPNDGEQKQKKKRKSRAEIARERAERWKAKLAERKQQRLQKKLQKQQQGGGGQQQGAAAAAAAAEEEPATDVSAWRELLLHPLVERALAKQGFGAPTDIQRACLPPAIHERLDIIGAAQTGSGKTLAFGLPIMQLLLQEREMYAATESDAGLGVNPHAGKLRALILTPTRELALQVCSHLQSMGKVCGVRAVAIVGGLAHVKQERLLACKPEVIVATPGRLWELMREGIPHVTVLDSLSFLVLDEADRMVQKGHYQELSSILDLVPHPSRTRQNTVDADFEEAFAQDTAREAQQQEQQKGKGGKRQQASGKRAAAGAAAGGEDDGEALASSGLEEDAFDGEGGQEGEEGDLPTDSEGKEEEGEDDDDLMLEAMMGSDDAGEEEEGEEDADDDSDDELGEEELKEAADEEEEEEAEEGQEGEEQPGEQEEGDDAAAAAGGSKPQGSKQQRPRKKGSRVVLQTFVFSATLTLPDELRRRLRKGGGGAVGGSTFQNLMNRLVFRGTPKIIDLTTQRKLATRVEESCLECVEDDKDAMLYYLLARHPGRTLVFVNAVSALRRVAAILKHLGLPAHALHAQQQQRQRLKALDRFKTHEQAVLVATDVAARGLDITGVRCVIHYQLPASADTYIHRSGRTARGLNADGVSIAMVSPREAQRFAALCRVLGREAPPPAFPLDKSLLPQVHQRVKLALKLDELERAERKAHAHHTWEKSNADEIGVILSDDEGGDEEAGGRKGKQGKSQGGNNRGSNKQVAAQMRSLQAQLASLLSAPLVPKMSARFFTGGAAAGVQMVTGAKLAPAAAGANGKGSAVAADAEELGGAAPAGAMVANAVAYAARLTASKETAAAAVAAKQKGKKQGKQQQGKPQQQQRVVSKELLAQQALMKKQAKKKGLKVQSVQKGGLYVIPPAFGRDAQGPDALDALKKRIALLGSSK